MDEPSPPLPHARIRILGEPLSLWIIAVLGLGLLGVLLGYFMWRLAQDPLEMELPPESPPPIAAPVR